MKNLVEAIDLDSRSRSILFQQSTDPDIAIISEKKEEDVLDVNLIKFDDKTDETDKDIEDLQRELTKM